MNLFNYGIDISIRVQKLCFTCLLVEVILLQNSELTFFLMLQLLNLAVLAVGVLSFLNEKIYLVLRVFFFFAP